MEAQTLVPFVQDLEELDRNKAPVLKERERANKMKDEMERRLAAMQETMNKMQEEMRKMREEKEQVRANSSHASLDSSEPPVATDWPGLVAMELLELPDLPKDAPLLDTADSVLD